MVVSHVLGGDQNLSKHFVVYGSDQCATTVQRAPVPIRSVPQTAAADRRAAARRNRISTRSRLKQSLNVCEPDHYSSMLMEQVGHALCMAGLGHTVPALARRMMYYNAFSAYW